MTNFERKIICAQCMGLCGGVKHALALFEQTRAALPADTVLYVLHELVHNRYVTSGMQVRNTAFITRADELPCGATVIIGAHGLDLASEAQLRERAGSVVDATCPMVKRLQHAAAELAPEDDMVFYGCAGHPEVLGVISYSHSATPCRIVRTIEDIAALPELHRPVLFCQTTLNSTGAEALFTALRARFPQARRVSAVCNASSERQNAVLQMLPQIDALVVVGSANSSNANRLREMGEAHGVPSWLIDDIAQLPESIYALTRIGITAGASTPPEQIEQIVNALRQHK